MSLQVRPNYVNPLTTMKKKTEGLKLGERPFEESDKKSEDVSELQTKQQQLQNEMILMKTTGSDAAGMTADKLELLKAQLDETTAALQSAKNQTANSIEEKTDIEANKVKDISQHLNSNTSNTHRRSNMDHYEKGIEDTASMGIYHLGSNENNGYMVSFLPYSE